MIYITGDTHGDFARIRDFCVGFDTQEEDIMIILGDAGINYYGAPYDDHKKESLSYYPIQFFCIHGNHECRPQNIETYIEKEFHGGMVYVEEKYPNIMFAKDGEIYDFNGSKVLVIGGAYSVDKDYRIHYGYQWWNDEQPSLEVKQRVESKLDEVNWHVDVVLTHTTPLKYEPTEAFLEGINQNLVDKSTEIWLDHIEERLDYKKWYCGHYHIDKKIDKIELMFNKIGLFDK